MYRVRTYRRRGREASGDDAGGGGGGDREGIDWVARVWGEWGKGIERECGGFVWKLERRTELKRELKQSYIFVLFEFFLNLSRLILLS